MTNSDPIPAPPRAPSLLRFLLTGFGFFIAFAALLWWQQNGQDSLFSYPSDESYIDLAVARSWAETGLPMLGSDLVPLQNNGLWRAIISIAVKYGMDLAGSPTLLSLLAGLLSIPAFLSLSRVVAVRASLMWWAIIAWALMGPVIPDAFTGQPLTVGALLILCALFAHAYALRSDETPLPVAAALWIALAALFRIEFVALWLACGFHVLLLRILRRVNTGYVTLLIRWLTGVVIFAIVLCPIIWWNMRAIGVPWPPAPDTTLTLNAVEHPSAIHNFAVLGLSAAFSSIWHGPLLENALLKLFAVIGVVLVLVDILRKQLDWAATTLLFGFIVPFAFAPFYPFLGVSGLPALMTALTPLWLLLIGYTVVAVVRVVDRLVEKAQLPLPGKWVSVIVAVLIGVIPLFAGVRDQGSHWREHRAAQSEQMEARAALAKSLSAKVVSKETVLASDAPGWLLYEGYESALDLQGRLQPVLLDYVTASGVRDADGLRDYLAFRKVQYGVLWSHGDAALMRLFECPADELPPTICEFSWRADP